MCLDVIQNIIILQRINKTNMTSTFLYKVHIGTDAKKKLRNEFGTPSVNRKVQATGMKWSLSGLFRYSWLILQIFQIYCLVFNKKIYEIIK